MFVLIKIIKLCVVRANLHTVDRDRKWIVGGYDERCRIDCWAARDIKSFGEANVRKFYEMNLLKDVPGVYRLDFNAISKLEGFGKKSIDNLQAAIEASKQQPLRLGMWERENMFLQLG